MAQSVELPKDVLEKLSQQPPTESRRSTVLPIPQPSAVKGADASAIDADKMRSVNDLLEQVESNRRAQSGTVKAFGAGAQIKLQHDLTKVRENFDTITEAPFGEALSGVTADFKGATVTTPATVEYRTTNTPDVAEKIVAIKTKNTVAASAFGSGEQPVSLRVNNAGLSAAQIAGPESELPVNVQVGSDVRQMKAGDVGRFGNIEVRILASSNRSNKIGREGLPYALRLQVMPAQQ
jgi:hypothetical protein